MVPNFRDRSITFGTAVDRLLAGMSGILLTSFLEPLERELAVQVEYDMDEQGKFVRRGSDSPSTNFLSRYGVARQREHRTQEGAGGSSVLRDFRDHHGPFGERLV